MFKAKLDEETYNAVEKILRNQYKGDKGYNAGSQLIQIAGISFLNGLDHYIKEKLHIKGYIRYMDDLILIHQNKEYLNICLKEIQVYLATLKLKVHEKKTKIHIFQYFIKEIIAIILPILVLFISYFLFGVLCGLYDTLCHHCACNLEETCNIRTLYVVDVAILACTIFYASAVDVMHNLVQHFVDFCTAPVYFARVLAHLET